jgi:hypothetical protein
VLDLPAQRAPGVGDADVDHVGGRVGARHQRLQGSAPNLVVDPAMAWIDEQLILDGADAAHGLRDVDRTETSIALEPVTRDHFADSLPSARELEPRPSANWSSSRSCAARSSPPSGAVRDGAGQAPTDSGALISRVRILPVDPFGSSSTIHTWRGYL